MTKYIGLTIGPIYKTISMARKTRELWGASYIFSYIMKKIIQNVNEKLNAKIVLPYTDKELFNTHNGIGLFPDRLVFEAKEGDFERLQQITSLIIDDLGEKLDDKSFVKNYFQIYFLEMNCSADYKEMIKQINCLLDNMELQVSYNKKEPVNKVIDFFKNHLNNSFLIEEAFDKKRNSFPSLIKISTRDLHENQKMKKIIDDFNDDESDTKVYEELSKISHEKESVHKYHKYIAIVQADGDNMGKTIESLKSNEEFSSFSQKISNFAKEAVKLISEYRGVNIYAGGDDLLFIAPVANKLVHSNIFQLIEKLSDNFDMQFKDYNEKPSISFGLSISYYKFPMGEAIKEAYEQLKKAKKMHRSNEEIKNALCFKLLKHSGQFFEVDLYKRSIEYQKFMALVSHEFEVNQKSGTKEKEIFSSIAHKLSSMEVLISEISDDSEKIKNFFDNHFNENIHYSDLKNKVHKDYIQDVRELTCATLSSEYHIKNHHDYKTKLFNLYSLLRANKFIREK